MKYEYWFAALKFPSDMKKIRLRTVLSSGREIYYIEEKELKMYSFLTEEDVSNIIASKRTWDIQKEFETLTKKETTFIPFFDSRYPEKLKDIYNPPYAIYVKGSLPDESLPAIAVVGARKCTPYGEKYAMEFAAALANGGANIISGMANGIDGASQRAALDAGGNTYAVLGSGADVCYPRNHIGLYMDILDHGGGIISEQIPGTEPFAWNFPQRNRIISGLSDVVLVMEAKEKSGSLITADLAMDQGKDVYALPGQISSAYSQGCNRLIKQGAGILLSPSELVKDLSINKHFYLSNFSKKEKEKEIKLETTENLVYSCLDFDSKNLDTIVKETNLPALKVINVLIALELKGLVKEIAKNYYVKI